MQCTRLGVFFPLLSLISLDCWYTAGCGRCNVGDWASGQSGDENQIRVSQTEFIARK
ncbi:uncharacterized protein BO66DRAFT_389330 [Aspergillus aculeatinus CBS 121060]|uniref:Uncharacterized protein n=1 Tax=Aspergillus aculeatinus CBS 121060 TaxID=1448322 RepID=A0ACD1HHR1_9EURO|nr:hypothetical protein BO66DRAFT_389330 [Aspergillus aculeatinus CBS 121060]RAH73207.1 hypothetical protein BO66DRAFT_389330 [Aspergillus aculeatinus CBS 121060]